IRCSQCIIDNGCLDPAQLGGSCEDTPGIAPASCSDVVGTTGNLTETQVCLATLDTIFVSGCGSGGTLVRCLCGATDASACVNGSVPPQGPAFPLYVCDFGSSNVSTITSNFTAQSFGAGQANALAQCAGAFGCNCF